jgi:stalled ribosome alternative rescue factor ArfA
MKATGILQAKSIRKSFIEPKDGTVRTAGFNSSQPQPRGGIEMKKEKVDRRVFKKEGEELQQYLHFRKRGGIVKNKKGKGSYNRQTAKQTREE